MVFRCCGRKPKAHPRPNPRNRGCFRRCAGCVRPVQLVRTIGPNSRGSVLRLSIMNGPDLQDPYTVPAPLDRPGNVDLGPLRVATYLDDGIADRRRGHGRRSCGAGDDRRRAQHTRLRRPDHGTVVGVALLAAEIAEVGSNRICRRSAQRIPPKNSPNSSGRQERSTFRCRRRGAASSPSTSTASRC